MKIEQWELSDIKPYEFNNRTHSDEQVKRVAKSIKEFGWTQPIVVDEKAIVLVGHGRLIAAKHLNLDTAPVLQIKDLSETKKRAYRILDNKLQNDSTWAFNNLELELGALEDEGFDLPEWGLDDLRALFPEEEPEVTDDEFEASEQDETFIKKGDVIELGKHRVMCADNSEIENLSALMQGEKTGLLLTDPPYNVAQDTELYGKDVSKSLKELSNSEWDFDFSPTIFLNNIKEILKVDSWLYVFTSHALFGEIVDWMNKERGHAGFCVWCKPNPMPSLAKNVWTFAVELCPFSKLGRPVFNYPDGEHCLNWWEMAKKSDGTHPTQKTIEVIANIINRCSAKGDLIVDPFLGSGTTLIACEQLNRTCYGMEIDPKYCQVIIERYQKHCEKSGKPFECKINGESFNFPSIKKDYEKAA